MRCVVRIRSVAYLHNNINEREEHKEPTIEHFFCFEGLRQGTVDWVSKRKLGEMGKLKF